MTRRRVVVWGSGWHWPVPDIVVHGETFPAVVSQEMHTGHNGVDIAYRSTLETRAMLKSAFNEPHVWGAEERFFAPVGVPVVAAKDGKVWSINKTARGIGVVLDHGAPFATFYQHLESTQLTGIGQPVKAGDVIGVMGYDPTDAEGMNHLHFEAWFNGAASAAVDPQQAMATWSRVTWTKEAWS